MTYKGHKEENGGNAKVHDADFHEGSLQANVLHGVG
jgi:hypothetical protein